MASIFMLFLLFHIFQVLLCFTICFGCRDNSVAFPLHSLSWAFNPASSQRFISEQPVRYQKRESGPLFKEQDGEEGPEKASTGCDIVKERLMLFF